MDWTREDELYRLVGCIGGEVDQMERRIAACERHTLTASLVSFVMGLALAAAVVVMVSTATRPASTLMHASGGGEAASGVAGGAYGGACSAAGSGI